MAQLYSTLLDSTGTEVMIHSGSRGLGHQVATDALVDMERAMWGAYKALSWLSKDSRQYPHERPAVGLCSDSFSHTAIIDVLGV